MKNVFLVFGFVVATLLCGTGARADNMFRIVVFGDSLTSGYQLQPSEAYAAKLQQKLKEIGYQNVETTSMSVDGETTAGGLERINKLLAARPDVVVLQLGANDMLRGINTNLVHRNLATILEQLLDRRVYVLLVGVKAPPGVAQDYAKNIDSIYYNLANRYGVPFYPNALEGISDRRELTLADGFHPNSKGLDVLVEATYRMIDAGLRWKYEVLQYQQQLRQSQQMNQMPIAPAAPR